jgi:hypothetical protein
MDNTSKKCTKCLKEKPLSDFYECPRCQDGRRVRCAECYSKPMIDTAKSKEKIGLNFPTREGGSCTIIDYINKEDITIQFDDGTITYHNQISPIRRGTLKNPNKISVLGVGCIGQGKYKTRLNEKLSFIYQTWINMLKRVYTEAYQRRFPTYKDVTVCEEWHNFQNFAGWFEENYKPEYMHGWHLDKDIICRECKIYSPETCVFVPMVINTFIVPNRKQRGDLPIGVTMRGNRYLAQITHRASTRKSLGMFNTADEAFYAYKKVKEQLAKDLAENYKGKIDDRVYQMLINLDVKITD